MKRKAEKKYPNIYKIWPIFSWRLCVACKEEFRRESGWVEITGYRAVFHYACAECCPTKQNVHEAIKKYRKVQMGQRPSPPPPIPIPPRNLILKDGKTIKR